MMTLEHLQQPDLLPMELPLTLSAAAFPAKTLAQQEKAQGLQANAADYGAKLPVLLASYDHPTSSWRTCQHFLDEGLERFSETWPRSGMMRSGTAYQLPTLAHLTDGTASGLWPTPDTRGFCNKGSMSMVARKARNYEEFAGMCYRGGNKKKFWPTPQASDNRDRGNPSSGAVKRRMQKGKQISLSQSVSEVYGQLNPTWVEWLMGFPIGWTDLKPAETP